MKQEEKKLADTEQKSERKRIQEDNVRRKEAAKLKEAKEKDKVNVKKSGRPKLKKKATKKAEAEQQVELEI